MTEITAHAATRYCERVNPRLTIDEARCAIRDHQWAIDVAVRERAPVVKLGTGHKLLIINDVVVTVLPRGSVFWSER